MVTVDNSLETRKKYRHGDRETDKKESTTKTKVESANKTTPEQDAGMKDTKKKAQELNKAANKDPISLAFLLSPENSVVELQQTSLPSITEKDVLKFASDKVKEFHKISFTDYIEYITSLEDEFTNQRAFDNYQLQMMNSKLIDQITSRKLTSWSEPTSAPRIVDFDEDNYIWHIQMTFDWFMGGGNYSTNGREYQIDLIIHSVSRDKNIRGLAVDSYFLKSVRG